MRRLAWFLLFIFAVATPAAAHFVFVVPDGEGQARIVLSETPKPDPEVDVAMIGGTRVSFRTLDGREIPLTFVRGEHAFLVPLPFGARGVVHGVSDLGVNTREGATPNVLIYYPKTIVGDAFDARTRLGDLMPVELVPVGSPSGFRLQLLARGKPQAHAEITVIGPDGSEGVIKTDDEGRTGEFTAPGRYGAWARYWEVAPGERDGKKYEELRHYATLVFDVQAPSDASASRRDAAAARFATLSEETSSFGAVASDGWLYVYGGHIARTHRYSTASVSGRFSRFRLDGSTTWETLPAGRPLQGLNLAAHGGAIYRVGGMQPQNPPGQAPDLRSVADVARFDPVAAAWETLPSLPSPRSSHDVAVVGSTLMVVGGWDLQGETEGSPWAESLAMMDLASDRPAWRSVPQPFKRRALIAAAFGNKLWVMGGMNDRNEVERAVSIYDPTSGTWRDGPPLPGPEQSAFAPAACVIEDRLYVSLADGGLYRLRPDGDGWEKVGSASRRVAHRLVPRGRQVLVIGGAANEANLDLVEAITVP